MLILKRKIDESIVLTSPNIKGEIVIKFIRNNYEGLGRAAPTASITIGITAPSDVLILRSELTSGNPDDKHELKISRRVIKAAIIAKGICVDLRAMYESHAGSYSLAVQDVIDALRSEIIRPE